jgi:prophage antirepressor-like protein
MDLIKHPEFGEIRTVKQSGTVWFVAKDVYEVLELAKRGRIIWDPLTRTKSV